MKELFDGIFYDLPVLITGHTGFKGSWLAIWLKELGANVIGYSLEPPTSPSNFEVSSLQSRIIDLRGDIRDLEGLKKVFEQYQPVLVLHLAAQAIVRTSYLQPQDTFEINALGTVNLLEAVRQSESVKALICITTDKCYENQEWLWGYRENDRLGGYDPYSASKAMAELAIASYRFSFFLSGGHKAAIASTRAGNVIGGGDWAKDRLLPDCMRSLLTDKPIYVRNPYSIRPWQHVFEPLSGYLNLSARLLKDGKGFAQAWNFGPMEYRSITTRALVEKVIELWGQGEWKDVSTKDAPHETGMLRLSWEKAANLLHWQPVYTWTQALEETVNWFKAYQQSNHERDMYQTCVDHIHQYVDKARELKVDWASQITSW